MLAVEPPGQLPGACDPAAELDLAQMGSDDDALAGLGSGIHFAWREIQQLMDGATDEPLSDSLLDSLRDAALDGAPLHAGAPPPLLHLNEVSGGADLSGLKRPRGTATQPPAVIRPRPQAPPLMLSEHEQARRARRPTARAPTRAATLPHPVTDGVSSRAQGRRERLLPLSNLGRIMKRVLPHDAKVSKGSKEAMQEMVGEFICFVTSEANDLCKEDPQPGKKTLHGAHITGACANLDLAELVAPIRAAALPTSRGSLPDARAKGKIAKQNSFNDLTSIEAHAMSSLAVAC